MLYILIVTMKVKLSERFVYFKRFSKSNYSIISNSISYIYTYVKISMYRLLLLLCLRTRSRSSIVSFVLRNSAIAFTPSSPIFLSITNHCYHNTFLFHTLLSTKVKLSGVLLQLSDIFAHCYCCQ